jgi:hypothetical protein
LDVLTKNKCVYVRAAPCVHKQGLRFNNRDKEMCVVRVQPPVNGESIIACVAPMVYKM